MFGPLLRTAASLCVMLCITGCAAKAPASLTPVGVVFYQANQALLILDTVQHAAIGLNAIQRCDPLPAPPQTNCRPLLSDTNTRMVINTVADSVNSIRAIPNGWRVATSTALQRIGEKLDKPGQASLGAYLVAASQILLTIV